MTGAGEWLLLSVLGSRGFFLSSLVSGFGVSVPSGSISWHLLRAQPQTSFFQQEYSTVPWSSMGRGRLPFKSGLILVFQEAQEWAWGLRAIPEDVSMLQVGVFPTSSPKTPDGRWRSKSRVRGCALISQMVRSFFPNPTVMILWSEQVNPTLSHCWQDSRGWFFLNICYTAPGALETPAQVLDPDKNPTIPRDFPAVRITQSRVSKTFCFYPERKLAALRKRKRKRKLFLFWKTETKTGKTPRWGGYGMGQSVVLSPNFLSMWKC